LDLIDHRTTAVFSALRAYAASYGFNGLFSLLLGKLRVFLSKRLFLRTSGAGEYGQASQEQGRGMGKASIGHHECGY
jgi:hypothetical protein